MSTRNWLIAGLVVAAIVAGLAGTAAWRRQSELVDARRQIADLKGRNEEAGAALGELRETLEELRQGVVASKARIDELQRASEAAVSARDRLQDEMRKALQSKDVTISELQGKLTVNILDRLLFDSGSATLKPDGEAMLKQIAGVLASYPNRQVLVVGHTDNVPVKEAARRGYSSNWELSVARATAAVRYLCEKGGVDARRLGAAGYGEFRPVADNGTPEGRARNRRIALVVLSEELLGPEVGTAPAPAPAAGTAGPAPVPGKPAPAPAKAGAAAVGR